MTENDEYVNVNGHKDHTKSQTQNTHQEEHTHTHLHLHLIFFRAKNHEYIS